MATEGAAESGFGDRLRGFQRELGRGWGRLPKRAQSLIPALILLALLLLLYLAAQPTSG